MSLSVESTTGNYDAAEKRGTGLIFLAALVLFFGTVFAANGALVYYALSTFSGDQADRA